MKHNILGAIAGDIIGSRYEWHSTKKINFDLFHPKARFTDDTVLTVAVAESIMRGKSYLDCIKQVGQQYPDAGYGKFFTKWLQMQNPEPYDSWGNGSAMRVSPVGFAYNTLEEVLLEAKKSADVSHNHPEGVKGAQATAAAIFLARTGHNKKRIKEFIADTFKYDLNTPLSEIRPSYTFDVSCAGSVPQSISAFLEASNYEDAIRLAISLGGDADTMACITGGIALAYYEKMPKEIIRFALEKLTPKLKEVTLNFTEKYGE